jgi:recombination protein RecT
VSDEPEMVIPLDRLPPGFAENLDRPPADAAEPLPAATAVLVRDTDAVPELLLLKRHRAAGFVPGAWVFPGGKVDPADADPELVDLLGQTPRGPPAPYWVALVREVFEETGVLLARRPDAAAARAGAVGTAELEHWRAALLADSATLRDVLLALDARPDMSRVVYCSHWITPVAEPRRYDTRFFLAELPAGGVHSIDEREMSDALWITARAALDRFTRGTLPMVFPTVKTIQRLADYSGVDQMLADFRAQDVPPIMPRLVRTDEGVGIVVD